MPVSRGFTLIELLVVMVLVGLLVGMLGLSLSHSPARQAREEAALLMQQLQRLREQAVLEGREYGVRIEVDGYRMMRFEAPAWVVHGAVRRLPAGLSMRLELDGQTLSLGAQLDRPQLLLLSSDETSAFAVHFESVEQRWLSVFGDGLGEPILHEP